MALGLEKNLREKVRVIWNKTEGRTHSIGDRRAGNRERVYVQVTDQMFNDWVRQHQRLLFGIAYWWTGSRTDAEELTQEAFLQAYRSRSSLRDVELAKGWLVGILRHCHSQMRRRTKSRQEVCIDEMLHEPESRPTLSADALALHQSLEKLEERHRLPVVLFYFQDLSYREIAEALELPIGTVMSRLARARQQLHELMKAPAKLVLMKKAESL
jgi:RNA polymerase sigma-70 factor (ECF subfamily)